MGPIPKRDLVLDLGTEKPLREKKTEREKKGGRRRAIFEVFGGLSQPKVVLRNRGGTAVRATGGNDRRGLRKALETVGAICRERRYEEGTCWDISTQRKKSRKKKEGILKCVVHMGS